MVFDRQISDMPHLQNVFAAKLHIESNKSHRETLFKQRVLVCKLTISAESFSSCKYCRQTLTNDSTFPDAQTERKFLEKSAES